MCNKRARNDDIDDPTDDNNSMLMPQSTPDDSCHILEFGMCFGDKVCNLSLFYCRAMCLHYWRLNISTTTTTTGSILCPLSSHG